MGFEGAGAASATQFHEALVCPICPKLFVESLWSLIAHINAVHRDSPLVLDYHSLQRLKKIVPKSAVCVIRPAFTADGNRSDFLNFFAADETIGNSMTSELKESEASLRQRTLSFPEESESKSISPEPVSLDLSISRKSTSPPPSALKSPSISISSPKELTITTPPIASSSSSSSAPAITAVNGGGGNKRVKRHSPYPRATKKQLCQKCGELFDNRCLLTLHMMVHKRQTHPYQCPINGCFQLYDSKMKFRSHLNRVHRELTPVKMETIIKAAERGGDSNEINNGGFEMSNFEENNNFAKTSTEKLAETVEKVIIKQEIFDS